MPCYCTSSSLRLFIRTVTHVDVQVAGNLRHFQRQQTRRPAFRIQHAILSRSYSTEQSSAAQLPQPSNPAEVSQRWESDDVAPGEGGHDAIVEFSLDVLDQLAAESKSSPKYEPYESPAKTKDYVSSSHVSKRASHRPAESGRPIFRRTKTENTSFNLHLSSPRKPRLSKEELEGQNKPSKPEPEEWTPPTREHWMIDKEARKLKYPDGWNPQKRLSPDAIAGIRALHAQLPAKYTTPVLAETFEVSPEAISKILKSKWVPNADEETDRQRRWSKRGESIWSMKAELGAKPPKKWRKLGIGSCKPEFVAKRKPAEMSQPRRQFQPPALITMPRREGGIFALRPKRQPLNLEETL